MVVWSSFQYPESPMKFEESTRVFLDKKDYGIGTLFVSESTLCWKGSDSAGFSVPYTHITMHAVSKDRTVCAEDCIYIMIDSHVEMPGANHAPREAPAEVEGDDSDVESEVDISELLLIPENKALINVLYEKITECQELNPDPDDVSEDDDDEEHMYEDAEDEGVYDIGGGGDTGDAEMENVTNRMSSNSIQVSYQYSNGNQQEDEHFEDAD